MCLAPVPPLLRAKHDPWPLGKKGGGGQGGCLRNLATWQVLGLRGAATFVYDSALSCGRYREAHATCGR
jgi:hypothetical protein